MTDIFLKEEPLNQEQLLSLVLDCEFEEDMFECIGCPTSFQYSFNGLLEQIELNDLWAKLNKRLPEQSDQWLNEFSIRLVQHPGKSQISCLVVMSDCYDCNEGRLFHLLSASTWPWEYGRQQDLVKAESDLQQLKSQLVENGESLHLLMLEDTLGKLQTYKIGQ